MYKREYRTRYILKHPWARHWGSSKSRVKKSGLEHTLKISDFKELWFRDRAQLLKHPSIDRIDNTKGYVDGNCRFIEWGENSSRQHRGRLNNEKQNFASSENIRNYNLSRNKHSKYEGVTKGWGGRWLASIRIKSKKKHLGTFTTEQEAVVAIKMVKEAGYIVVKQF